MKPSENLDPLRTEYMISLAELAGLSVDRASHLSCDAGMNALRTLQEAAESKQIIEKITKQIADVCNKLRAIEQRSRGSMGIPALFNKDVPNVIRIVVAILAGKNISGSWRHETRSIGQMLAPAGGADPQELLTVRESFRKKGLLRPHIHCDPGRTLDEWSNLTLTESAFRKLLALEPDTECEELLQARELVAMLGKR